MTLRAEPMPDDRNLRAFVYGPLVLAHRLSETKVPDSLVVGLQAPVLNKQPPPENSVLSARQADLREWERVSGTDIQFRVPDSQNLTFVPFNGIKAGERYSIYWKTT